jgi:tetraacyldisaccharide 4'-kinase
MKYLIMKLKKPKFWDNKKPNFISQLLYPFSKIVELRSYIKKKPVKVDGIKTICIGNIYIGGTGKTSLAIEIKKHLDLINLRSCFIKKDYQNQIDEQKLLESYGATIIRNSRLDALCEAKKKGYQIAIFDDGLQDNTIDYDISFACFNKKNLIGNGRIIPAGPLRESLKKLQKYENVFMIGNQENIKNDFLNNSSSLNFFEAIYDPLNLDQFKKDENFIVFSGIGNHKTFIEMLINHQINIIEDLEFPDHYDYNEKDIKKIFKLAKLSNSNIVTTEKDYLRLPTKFREKIRFIKIQLKIKEIEKLKNKLNEINK